MKRTLILLTSAIMSVSSITLINEKSYPTEVIATTTWKKGMPKRLIGNWRHRPDTLEIRKNSVYVMPDNGAAVSKTKRIISRRIKRNQYQYKVFWREGGSYTGKITIKHTKKGMYAVFEGTSYKKMRN
ncbi:hypothetical protein KDZ21_03125 [Lactobacillus crispatus]|uniref:DUF5626 domain-containing protein n=1 Tax=Lactobacillus crispatus TaxID=47770 RepID=A0AAW8WR00_9LACO|nr:hypothetical protein [Lactobacillus crispatus]MBW0438095.1 hypothetical protein [Lactobacillus crispatus]MBW0443594.1 hypothetical protein [Lactobacillus crispatus]MBW0456803.1 hypothetical protein [Lactobacillus crispatus]MDK6666403.1 hypothetical protein [Lactobacillus crispatus]MDK8612311.1 hypothetical protein [Lactobacillus crispatus]